MRDTNTVDVPTRTRRSRYARAPSSKAIMPLTPVKVEMLHYLAELRFLSLPQLARLCCPSDRRDLSEKSARRHLRFLFDAGLVDVLPVSRAAMAPPGAANDAALLYGSAPNVYALTARALKLLRSAGVIGEDLMKRPTPAYGPRNGLFLAHELAVRDVRVWLELSANAGGHEIECWKDGEAAAISLGRARSPLQVRPDARFVYRLGTAVLVGLVEVDRGTERGDRRWQEKLDAYGALFAGVALREATGYVNARVLVVCPDARRRDGLAGLIQSAAPPGLAGRFWLTENAATLLRSACWRRPGESGLRPLIPATDGPQPGIVSTHA